MNSDRLRAIGLPLALLPLLAACADYSASQGRIDPASFGEASRQTQAAMIVDPDPVYDTELATSAQKAAAAVERYRAGSVTQPDRVSSTAGGGGGGSSPN